LRHAIVERNQVNVFLSTSRDFLGYWSRDRELGRVGVGDDISDAWRPWTNEFIFATTHPCLSISLKLSDTLFQTNHFVFYSIANWIIYTGLDGALFIFAVWAKNDEFPFIYGEALSINSPYSSCISLRTWCVFSPTGIIVTYKLWF
jgi:hypothetical protein